MPVKLDPSIVGKAEELLRSYLRQRGLKLTPERQVLLKAILASEDHFEPEDLLITLRQQGIRIGKATIYRTLPLLVDCGIIRRAYFGQNRAYYEHSLGPTPHDHMICRSCGRVVEFDSTDLLRLRERLAAEAGFQVLSHRFQIAGICPDCAGDPQRAFDARREAASRNGASG